MSPAFRILLGIAGLFLCCQCSTSHMPKEIGTSRLQEKTYRSFDGDHFGYTSWLSKKKPEIVIIGVHGISGAASDYRPLAEHLTEKQNRITIYAPETRGQGNDPIKARRGDIGHRDEWFQDLTVFTALIREKHPKAKVIWAGESMGSLIVMHTYAKAEQGKPPCDAIILASPITAFRSDFPRWKEVAVRILGTLFPGFRVSLGGFANDDEVRVTKDTVHDEQAATNDYHVEHQTLRLLTTLGSLIRGMPTAAQTVKVPTLILHGGKDVFSDPKDVQNFAQNFPLPSHITRKFYPESFHLLFHDHQSQEVVKDIESWIEDLD